MSEGRSMLEEFKTLYDIHSWLRYITWAGLGSAAIFLVWASGGIPPQSWLLLMEAVPQIPGWWHENGSAVLFPLFVLVALSLVWALGWYALGWVVLALVRHHRRLSQLKQRQDELVEMSLDWEASHNFALASVLPQAHAPVRNELPASVPMLRLPQKQVLSQTARASSLCRQAVLSLWMIPLRSRRGPISMSLPRHNCQPDHAWCSNWRWALAGMWAASAETRRMKMVWWWCRGRVPIMGGWSPLACSWWRTAWAAMKAVRRPAGSRSNA